MLTLDDCHLLRHTHSKSTNQSKPRSMKTFSAKFEAMDAGKQAFLITSYLLLIINETTTVKLMDFFVLELIASPL